MRKENLVFTGSMPLYIEYISVKDYPIHWHNCIEILYVLEGRINISIDTDNFDIYQNELEIINPFETHIIHADKDNKVLVFHIDPQFFKKYYSDIENMFFYTNTSDDGAQDDPQYDEFRTILVKLLCEFSQRQENYKNEIEKLLIDLLFLLINNFNYLIYEKEELKDNNEQLERYHRISKYIFNNYQNNITLQSIAKKEFLSPHYLSHEIKNTTGYSFTDLLNLTRVEESVKLLLETDLSISDISGEVGFSHPRYLNKHFKVFYKCTPLQFRRKHKMNEKNYEKSKITIFFKLNESFELLHAKLQEYERYNYQNKIKSIQIDVSKSIGSLDKSYMNVIGLGDAFDLLIEENKDNLESILNEINFGYGRIENFFNSDMGVFKGKKFINWNRSKSVLQYLNYIHLNPLIVLDNLDLSSSEYENCIKSFCAYFSEIEYLDLSKIKFQFSDEIDDNIKISLKKLIAEELHFEIIDKEYKKKKDLDTVYDTAYMLPFIIDKELNKTKDMSFLKAFDVIETIPKLNNEVFIGYPGLVNDMNIRKPSYYAYYLLNKLSGDIVCRDNGYIVTKDNGNYCILLYTCNGDGSGYNVTDQKYSLNITNINSDSRIIFYKINDLEGSSYNYWKSMGSPIRLSIEEMEILKRASYPKIEFKFSKRSSVLNLRTTLTGYGATLITIITK